eukprot:augustus_masked-scaffold_19-processed-gene-1.9-mRNA-1 protein AED:0.18 eAED:0.18 QI:0/-1/0/1/-1/1/1/0/523
MAEEAEKEIKELQIEDAQAAKVEEEEAEGLINQKAKEHEANATPGFSVKAQLIATLIIVGAAAVGVGVGVILSNNEANDDVVSWLGLPGDLFIRSLTCVVLPLIFVNVILAVIQMIEAGKAGAVGKYTVAMYLLSTFMASIIGLVAVLVFRDQFETLESDDSETFILLQCPDGGFVTAEEDGSLVCAEESSNQSQFELDDPNGYLVTADGDIEDTISFSQTLQDGIFRKLVPNNIVAEFANGGFVGVIMFGIVFGTAAQYLSKKPVLLIDFLEDVNDILAKIIGWIILLTPIAVFSLIASTLGAQADLEQTFNDIRVLIFAALSAFITHILIAYPLIFFLITRTNPFAYLRYIVPAQIFAFSCASSAATLPVTIRCVTETGQVPNSIRDFVLPIGATINMDGTGLYFPPAIVYLAMTGGFDDQLDAAAMFLILVVSTIGSAGTAPVPNAGLVLIITAFNTVFSSSGTPRNFGIIIGIDWLMDRFQTSLNITGDTLVARIVTQLSGVNVEGGVTSEMPVSQISN